MAIERDITSDDEWYVGEDKSLVVSVFQSNGTTAQDVTGWAISFMLKKKATDTDANAKVTKTTAAGGIALTTPASGIITIAVLDTDTDGLAAGAYVYEVKRTDANSETILTRGNCLLKQAVHRA